MSTKYNELHDEDSTLNKAADDEPLFILRGTDRTAIAVINTWITIAGFAGVPAEKIEEAMWLRQSMEAWQGANPTKIKMPD